MLAKLFYGCLLALALMVITPNASASDTFWKDVEIGQSNCPDLNCELSPVKKQAISSYQWRQIDLQTRNKLRSIARYMVNSYWPDTVLEGDLIIKGHTRLDQTYFVTKNEEVVGYWVVYSVRAWDVSTCNYDPIEYPSVEGCLEGRISEAAFIEVSLQSSRVDDHFSATFEALPVEQSSRF